MTVEQFEEAVWKVEGVRVVVRASTGTTIDDYDYKNAATKTWHVTEWLKNRVEPKLPEGFEVCVIDGSGEEPHGRTLLRTIRRTYEG